MGTDPSLIAAVASGFATVGGGLYWNRRKIRQLAGWAWGDESRKGHAERTEAVGEQLGSIEEKLDEEREERREHHREVREDVRVNRALTVDVAKNLVSVLDEQVESAEVDTEDVKPDWYEYATADRDDAGDIAFDGAHPPHDDD